PPRSTLFPYTTLFRSRNIKEEARHRRTAASRRHRRRPRRRRRGGLLAERHHFRLGKRPQHGREKAAGPPHRHLLPHRPVARHRRSEEHTAELQSRENL